MVLAYKKEVDVRAATDWQGFLLKFGTVEVPLSYIKMGDGNTQTPNQREEIKAERDDYTRKLMRVTADGMITKQIFQFKQMSYKKVKALQNVMKQGLVDKKQRKYNVTYWNLENMQYEKGDIYIPDIEYTIARADENDLIIGEFSMALIGYETSKVVS